ncbi:MAG: hypothetical protein NTY46_06045 [Candidatus Sumerlaeota bacterium]|nr:hypothetical protein [Candidatus Sumerlaeota bacterium]
MAAIAVPNFLEAQTRAKVSRSKADLRSWGTAIESYQVDNNRYPPFVARHATSLLGAPGADSLNGPSVWYTGTSGVSSRAEWCTTPIAYMSSAFLDPFIPGNVRYALNPDTRTPNLTYDTYDYVDAKSTFPTPAGISPFSGTARGGSICSGAMWHIAGCGPDRINAYGGNRNNNGTFAVRSLGADYDPTNGTISPGDIVRVGGGAGQNFPGGGLPTYDRIRGAMNP